MTCVYIVYNIFFYLLHIEYPLLDSRWHSLSLLLTPTKKNNPKNKLALFCGAVLDFACRLGLTFGGGEMSGIQIVLDQKLDTILRLIDLGFVSHVNAGDNFDDLLEEARDRGIVSGESDGWFVIGGVAVYSYNPETYGSLTFTV